MLPANDAVSVATQVARGLFLNTLFSKTDILNISRFDWEGEGGGARIN